MLRLLCAPAAPLYRAAGPAQRLDVEALRTTSTLSDMILMSRCGTRSAPHAASNRTDDE